MARVENNYQELHGKVGNMIYYRWKGILCARRRVFHYSKPPSSSQIEIRNHFKACSLMYKFLSPEFLVPWQMAAASTTMNGRNLFISRNIYAFKKGNSSPDFERLHFSTGKLLLPGGLCNTPLSGGKWRLCWEYDEEDEWTSPADRLYIAELHTDNPLCPLPVKNITACRRDCVAEFSTNQAMGPETHLYCFWSNADGTVFSESRYFRGVSE